MENKKKYYRVASRIMILDERNTEPCPRKPFIVMDPCNSLMHMGDPEDAYLLSFLVKPKSREEIIKYFRLTPFLRDYHLSDIETLLKSYIEKSVIITSDKPFKVSEQEANLFVGKRIKLLDEKIVVRAFPHTIAFMPTATCNLKCIHCSAAREGTPNRKDELGMDEIISLFDKLEGSSLYELRITGGEPLVRKDAMEIVEEAAKRKFRLILYTNCHALNEEKIAKLKKIQSHKNRGFILHYSIDGASSQTHDWLRGQKGAFEKLTKNLELLKNAGIRLIAETIVNQRNISEIRQICDLAAKYGTEVLNMHPVSYVGKAIDNISKNLILSPEQISNVNDIIWKSQLKYEETMSVSFGMTGLPLYPFRSKRATERDRLCGENANSKFNDAKKSRESGWRPARCSAGVSQMTIAADGTVFPCPNFHGLEKYAMGNIRKEDPSDIWIKNSWNLLRGGWNYSDLPICHSCEYESKCVLPQTCRACPEITWGDWRGPAPMCVLYKKLYGFSIPDIGKYKIA